MWGNRNIDIWFYAMVTIVIASGSLFLTTSRKARWLYMTFPAMLGCWYAYETAVSLSVPIMRGIEPVIIRAIVAFPLLPIVMHYVRSRGNRIREISNE
jgi:hypothetical protein